MFFAYIKYDCGPLCLVFAQLARVIHMALTALLENYMDEGQVRILAQKHAFNKLQVDFCIQKSPP